MTTLQVFLSILAIIAIIVTVAVVLTLIVNLFLSIYDKRHKNISEDNLNEHYYKEDSKNREPYIRETEGKELAYKSNNLVANNVDLDIAKREEDELKRLHAEEEEVKSGKFSRNFNDISVVKPAVSTKSKEERIADIVEKYNDEDMVLSKSIIEEKPAPAPQKKEEDFSSFFDFDDNDDGDIDDIVDDISTETKTDEDDERILKIEKEIEELRDQISASNDAEEIRRLKAELETILAEKADLEAKQEEAQKEKEQREEELRQLNEEVERLKKELADAKASAEEREEVKRLLTELKEAKSNDESKEEIARLKQELKEAREAVKNDEYVEELQRLLEQAKLAQVEAENQVINDLKEQLNEYKIAAVEQESEAELIAELKEQVEKYKKEADENKANADEIDTLRKQLQENEAANAGEIDALRKQLQEKEIDSEEFNNLRRQLEQNRNYIADMYSKDEMITNLKSEVESLKQANQEKEEEENLIIAELKKELEEARSRIEQSQSNEEIIASLRAELEVLKNAEPEVKTEVVTERVLVGGAMSKEEIEAKIAILEERLKANEKDLKQIKKEYLPLDRVRKTLESDNRKLRRKEAIVAKQNVILYGVNNYVDIDDERAKKLNEEHELLDGLRMSVRKCEEVIAKNKDRIPVLEKTYNILTATNTQIKDDITELKKQLAELEDQYQ